MTYWWADYSDQSYTAPTPQNPNDTLFARLMMQNQYTNIGGVESLWDSHTVGAGNPTTQASSSQTAVRYYQVDVTGGAVASSTTQADTYSPDSTLHRYMPSVAVDRAGDMAIGYTTSNSTTDPAIKYAGRLAGDAANTITQSEQTLMQGTGAQSGSCGASTCERWGDYSAMSLDPDGCTFWYTNEYYLTDGLDHHTRIGAFKYPSCTPVGSGGTVSGTVTEGSSAIAGATVALGSRTTTTDATGHYSFSVSAGTYPSETASAAGYASGSKTTILVSDDATTTKSFTLVAAPQSGSFVDTTQVDFQLGIPSNTDPTTSSGNVILDQPVVLDQSNTDLSLSGSALTSGTWWGQTFTAGVTGKLQKADINIFCSACTGTTPDLTLSIRATSGGVPTGSDLASTQLAGTASGAGGYLSGAFAGSVTLSAGATYALLIRPNSNPSAGTYAATYSSSNAYAGGQRVVSVNGGSSWGTPTGPSRDLGFHVYVKAGYAASGTLVSSAKDANPSSADTAGWGTLSWTATTPAGTGISFQVAAADSPAGVFSFVGPDGTANTTFSSGASLAQFNGHRYLRYRARLTSSSSSTTPSLAQVTVSFANIGSGGGTSPTTLSVGSASGTYAGTASLAATLTSGGDPVAGKSVSFTVNGSAVGSATTNASGVATLASVSLGGIDAGSYPTGIAAAFARRRHLRSVERQRRPDGRQGDHDDVCLDERQPIGLQSGGAADRDGIKRRGHTRRQRPVQHRWPQLRLARQPRRHRPRHVVVHDNPRLGQPRHRCRLREQHQLLGQQWYVRPDRGQGERRRYRVEQHQPEHGRHDRQVHRHCRAAVAGNQDTGRQGQAIQERQARRHGAQAEWRCCALEDHAEGRQDVLYDGQIPGQRQLQRGDERRLLPGRQLTFSSSAGLEQAQDDNNQDERSDEHDAG